MRPAAPDSVHLTDFPEARDGVRDEPLEASVALARRWCRWVARPAPRQGSDAAAAGHRAREATRRRRVGAVRDAAVADALTAEVLDELNVKALDVLTDESGIFDGRSIRSCRCSARGTARRSGRSWRGRAPGSGNCWTTAAWRLVA